MQIQLTKELLTQFVEAASTRAQETLSANSTLTPTVFANTAFLWIIPSSVSHPLRRLLGLSTPFILLTAATKEEQKQQSKIVLQTIQNVVCGADPLSTWQSWGPASEPDSIREISQYRYDWSLQQLEPLSRDTARQLTAQYSQILPELCQDDAEMLAMPMLVYTNEVIPLANTLPPFYLAVFSPGDPTAFANVVAIKDHSGKLNTKSLELVVIDSSSNRRRVAAQHWAEYDLLGAPIPILSLDEPESSYVVLHGIWDVQPKDDRTSYSVSLPPVPPPAAQWLIELVNIQTTLQKQQQDLDNDTNISSLKALYTEIERLELWCKSWNEGTKWCEEMVISQEVREQFGRRIDEFIDTSICDTRGNTTLGRLGRSKKDIHQVAGFPIREDLDFTERLWNLSHYAHDDSDLSEIIAAVAEGLETRKLQPYIRHTAGHQISPLAQLIRDLLAIDQQRTLIDEARERERLAKQMDSWIDEQPLDAFVMVGIHKLRADFWFYFVGGHLATPKQIKPFLELDNREPQQIIDGFWRLLRVLEIWWQIQQAAPSLPRQFLSQIVGSLLTCFTNHDQSLDENLRVLLYLPLYSTEVQDFIKLIVDGFDPARYTVMANTLTGGDKRRMVYLTRTPGQVDNRYSCDLKDEVEEAGEEDEEYSVFKAGLF